MGRICCSIPQSSIWCICRFPMISLENLWGLPLKSLSCLLWIHQNPYEFCRESLENPWEIHIFNFRVDSCFTYRPNFHVDSSPPNIHQPRDSLQCPHDFAHRVYFFSTLLVHSDSLNGQSNMDWNRFFDWWQVGRGIQEAGYGQGVLRAG